MTTATFTFTPAETEAIWELYSKVSRRDQGVAWVPYIGKLTREQFELVLPKFIECTFSAYILGEGCRKTAMHRFTMWIELNIHGVNPGSEAYRVLRAVDKFSPYT